MSATDGRVYDKNGRKIVPWTIGDGRVIFLITPDELRQLPDGTELLSITGQHVSKGPGNHDPANPNYIDDDTRAGLLAYGLLEEPV